MVVEDTNSKIKILFFGFIFNISILFFWCETFREIAQYLRMRKHLGVNRSVDYFEFARAFAAIRGPIKKPPSAPYRRGDGDRESERDERDRSKSRDGRDDRESEWARSNRGIRDSRDRYYDDEGYNRTTRERGREVTPSFCTFFFTIDILTPHVFLRTLSYCFAV